MDLEVDANSRNICVAKAVATGLVWRSYLECGVWGGTTLPHLRSQPVQNRNDNSATVTFGRQQVTYETMELRVGVAVELLQYDRSL